MEENILIIGTGGLHARMIETCLGKNQNVASTFYSESFREETKPGKKPKKAAGAPPEKEKHFSLAWDPGSSLSSKNIILQAEQKLGRIDRAFLIFPSGKIAEPFHETATAAIQKILDYRVKSYILFLKDLINHFMEKKGGELYGILHFEEGEWSSPLTAGSYEMFRMILLSCLPLYEKEPFALTGFESESPDTAGYCDFILKQAAGKNKKSGSFFQYPPKGLFSAGSRRK